MASGRELEVAIMIDAVTLGASLNLRGIGDNTAGPVDLVELKNFVLSLGLHVVDGQLCVRYTPEEME